MPVGEGFLSKINKRLIDVAMSKIIMHYSGRATFAKAFVIMEQCDCAFCLHDAIDLVYLRVRF